MTAPREQLLAVLGEADVHLRDGESRQLLADEANGEHRVTDGRGWRSRPLSDSMLLAIRSDPAWMLLVALDERDPGGQ